MNTFTCVGADTISHQSYIVFRLLIIHYCTSVANQKPFCPTRVVLFTSDKRRNGTEKGWIVAKHITIPNLLACAK